MKKRQTNKESKFLLRYTEAEKAEVDALWKKHSKVPCLFRKVEDALHTSEGTVSIEMTPTDQKFNKSPYSTINSTKPTTSTDFINVQGTSMDSFQAKEVEESPGTTL